MWRLPLALRPDGTLAGLGADDTEAPVARNTATDVEGRPGGLLAEARACARRRASPRLPWSCRTARDVAAGLVGGLGLPERTRRMLYRHIAGTPYMPDGDVLRFVFEDVLGSESPFGPVFVAYRAVWEEPQLPGWWRPAMEEPSLARFRETADGGDGPLALPFASQRARDWWAGAVARSDWPPSEQTRIFERIAATPYLETSEPPGGQDDPYRGAL